MQTVYIIIAALGVCGWVVYSIFFMKKKNAPVQFQKVSTYKSEPGIISMDEIEMLNLINAHREGKGLSVLRPDKQAKILAGEHLQYMIDHNLCNHENFETRSAKLIELEAIKVTENVASGYSTNKSLFNAYITSEGHRKHIEMDSITHVGISTKLVDGRLWNVQLFVKF